MNSIAAARPVRLRLRLTATCLALACSLAACSESGDDDPPANAPVAGTTVPNPLATVPDGGIGGVAGDDPAGTTAPTGVPGPAPAPGTGFPAPAPAPSPGTGFPAPAPAPAPGNFATGTFQCGTINITVDAGDTITCNGTVYALDTTTGEVVPANQVPTGGTSGGPAPGGGSVAAQLTTAFVDEDNLELWVCSASSAQSADVGYAFGAGGQGIYYLIEGNTTTGSAQFNWQATGADSVLLNYPSSGTAEDITSIAFAGDGWTGFSNTDGQLDCGIAAIGNP